MVTEKSELYVTHQSSLSSIGTNLQHLTKTEVTMISLTGLNALQIFIFFSVKGRGKEKAGHTTSLETSTLLPAL